MVTVAEGQPFTVGNVQVRGTKVFSAAEVVLTMSLVKGARYTATALSAFTAQDLVTSVADGVVRGPVWLAQGRIATARGDRERALAYLRGAASILEFAEPPYAAVRDSARAALARLGATY